MTYYIHIENNTIISSGEVPMGDGFNSIEVTEEVYNDFLKNPNKYIYSNDNIIINPNYEQEQAIKRETEFKKDFFLTSLGYIRRKVSMKTGETKDFLTDLLPTIAMAVNSLQTVNIIAYNEPDFTQDITDWGALQIYIPATPQFIQECFNQISKDFTGI